MQTDRRIFVIEVYGEDLPKPVILPVWDAKDSLDFIKKRRGVMDAAGYAKPEYGWRMAKRDASSLRLD